MAKSSGRIMKAVGLALIVVGAGLGYWGYDLSGSVGSQIAGAVTGSQTDRVMTYYIAGAASFVVGLYVFFKK